MLVAFLFAIFWPGEAEAGESQADKSASAWWLTVPCCSDHEDSTKPYNEDNWGIGIEYKVNKAWSHALFTYPNSFNERTWGIGTSWTPELLQLDALGIVVRPGLFGGFFTGYEEGKVTPAISPIVQVEVFDKVGGNFLIVPKKFVGFAFKLKFN